MNKQVVILAGGRGTRMNSSEPKVLQLIKNKTMISRVFDSVEKCNLENLPVVIVGFKGEKVIEHLNGRANFVWQKEQLGTGHALSCTKKFLKNFNGSILVLYGDHPLINPETIKTLFCFHEKNSSVLTMMTTTVNDFFGWRNCLNNYGRIIRNQSNEILQIKEFKDCDDNEKNILEVNPGYYCFDSVWLWQNIDKLQNNNSQQEYYLTDLVELAVKQKIYPPEDGSVLRQKINSLEIEPIECLGVNTPEQKKLVENIIVCNKLEKI